MTKTKAIAIILIILAAIISVAVTFKILLKNKGLTLSSSEVSQNKNMSEKNLVRPAAVAGAFYSGDKTELKQMVQGFLDQASVSNELGVPRILIVPHAGHVYSGSVAAYSFKQLEGKSFRQAIIIGPSHNYPVSGLFLSSATHWQTPLGLIKLAAINKDLAKEDNLEVSDQVHAPEHAIEVEAPFLQIIGPEMEIVPIIVGQLNESQQKDFAKVLGKYLDSQTVLIVSVDLSHYHDYQTAKRLDQKSIDDILAFNSAGILTDEIDAPWALASVLQLAKEKNWRPKLLRYANSGDITGDKSKVVGYSAIVFYDPSYDAANQDIKEENMTQDNYTKLEEEELLRLARQTIETYLTTGKISEPQTDNQKFKEKRGVFVTLNKNGQLRGCIGYIQPIKPLIEAVRDNAISAAVEDNRFTPVTADELDDIEIEISILTVPQPDTRENIIKDKLGVVLQQGNRGATYLPQVWEGLSDPDQFFSSLCLKAGLSPSCYQDSGTKFSSYRAIVFQE